MKRILAYSLTCLMGLAFCGATVEAQSLISVGYERAPEERTIPLNARNRSPSEFPVVKAGLQPSIFSKGFGEVVDLALGEQGELYILDGRNGRITVITDRNRDGMPDITRKLSVTFNQPRSLVAHEGRLYVADQDAVWIYEAGEKKLFASLANVDIHRNHLPIIVSPDGNQILLGINFKNGTSSVLALNAKTGFAAIQATGTGPISAMAQAKGSLLWLSIDNRLIPVSNGQFDEAMARQLPAADGIKAVYLPDAEQLTAKGLGYLAGQFLVSQEQEFYNRKPGETSRNVVAISSTFGQPDGSAVPVIAGFLGNHGRSAWGQPGAMVWDERGLFLADQQNGIIWRIHQLEPKITFSDRAEPVKFYEAEDVKKPKASWGSSIENGSSIVTGSALATDWEENKLIPKETLMERLRREEKEATDTD